MAIPLKDSALLAWSTNFDTRVTASPTTFGLTTGQATSYTTLHDAFVAAYNAVSTPGARSKALVTAKDDAKAALLALARELYGLVSANTAVSDSNKDLIGVNVRKTPPTPVPVPVDAPALDILSVTGRTVSVRLHGDDTIRRGKPAGVKGAAIFSYVGTTPPADPASWHFEGNTGRSRLDVAFDSSLAAGTQVWLCAFWFNNRGQSGPGCDAVGVCLAGGSSVQQSMKLAA